MLFICCESFQTSQFYRRWINGGSFNAGHINCSGTTHITQRQFAESQVAENDVMQNISITGKSLQRHF